MSDSEALRGLQKFSSQWIREPGRTLVVGSKVYDDKPDRRQFYADAVGVDLFDGDGVDIVHDLEHPLPESAGTFDHVDCVSVLEHVRRPWLMAASIDAVMRPQATILVSVPFVWRVHNYPGDFWRMTAEALEVLFPNVKWMRTAFLAEGKLYTKVPKLTFRDTRWFARSELVAAGFKCASTS